MFDQRYPHLRRLADATDIPNDVRARLVRVAEEVDRRVGCHSCWNRETGQILFYLGDPSVCFPGWQIRVNGEYDVPDAGRVDQWTNYLNLSKMPWSEKEAELESKAKQREYESEKSRELALENHRPEVIQKIEHVRRKRRGMDKVIST